MTEEEKHYLQLLNDLKKQILNIEFEKIVSQYGCEYDKDFLGFLNVYKPLSDLIPKNFIIIDFGCYLAAQSFYFIKHKKYIGVDVIQLERFQPLNCEHYIGSIQEFISSKANFIQEEKDHIFAICSYVPDSNACELVRKTFSNVCCFYPAK